MNPLQAWCRWFLLRAFLLMVVLGVAFMLIGVAMAQTGNHGDGHAENHDWYSGLTQPGTGWSCCNAVRADGSGDCRPTRAYPDIHGVWHALIDGRWVPVPKRVVLPAEQNRDPLHAHICASKNGMIYCFLPAGPGG